jgi:hypothetical protein
MFLAVDELWAAPPGWGPYHYAMLSPVMFEDRSGYIVNLGTRESGQLVLNDQIAFTGMDLFINEFGMLDYNGNYD